jgi:pimeloyl-ACP methyl ester carboxylesterase
MLELDGARVAVEVPEAHAGTLHHCLHAGVADSRMWPRGLAAFDRRGFGRTELTGTRAWSAVKDTLAVLDALDAERAVLVGCSQGGRVAIDTALQAPERVEALVLVSPAISGAPEPSFEGELIREMEQAEQ